MKKNLLYIFLLFFSLHIYSQNKFKAGLKAGISTSQVAGDTYAGFNKAGIAGGGFVRADINEKWSTQFEILFIQKGSKHVGNPEKGDYTYYMMQLNYIEIPLLFQYHQKKFMYEVGPGIAYLTSYREYDTYSEITGLRPFNSTEINFNIGIDYNIIKNLNINWRYSNSLNAIRKHASGAAYWWNPGQQNNVLTFTLTYTFGNDKKEE